MKRFKDAPTIDLVRAYLYRTELAIRTNNGKLAQDSLTTAKSISLTEDEQSALVDEFAHVAELMNQEKE